MKAANRRESVPSHGFKAQIEGRAFGLLYVDARVQQVLHEHCLKGEAR